MFSFFLIMAVDGLCFSVTSDLFSHVHLSHFLMFSYTHHLQVFFGIPTGLLAASVSNTLLSRQ